ncbi:hypothetical protein WL94_22985 [Burkholderia cepacia]|uniref:PTS transporter subunit EIIC n=1 Tax=Burkholderia cepacia TaxID=292 RepID=UPI0007579533|nr:PTS transporter subunit EIIC [Burkholderia cepacia]KWF83895.1 hypothetical protein WL94_22985 [Burkholderia cepacia]
MAADTTERFGTLARAILDAIGGARNVRNHTHCMTRLRVNLVDPALADPAALRQLPGVLGLVAGDPLQVVIGPGAVKQVWSAFAQALSEHDAGDADPTDDAPPAAARRGNHAVRGFLRRIASIFTPLIPALVGAGLINALGGLLLLWARHSPADSASDLTFLATVASTIGSAFFAFLVIQVGMNAAREFDGTPSLGGAAASVMIVPALTKLHAFTLPLLGEIVLRPGQGGLMGALLAGVLVALLERKLRTRIPPAIETLVTPTVSLLVAGVATLFVLMPVADVLTNGVSALTTRLLNVGGMPAAFVLAASFVVLLMFGLHQALIPIHAQLIAQYGFTALFPILAMSGCGQAGAAFALYFRVKDAGLKQRIRDTLPTCMLGVSEPLLYSVTLPLGRPLVTSSIGGGIGALLLGYLASHGDFVGATTIGPANLMLIPLVTGPMGLGSSVAAYCVATATAYASAFVLTWFFGLTQDQRRQFVRPASRRIGPRADAPLPLQQPR